MALSIQGWFAVVPYERRGTDDQVLATFRFREHAVRWIEHFHGGQADITTVGTPAVTPTTAKGKTKPKKG